MGVNRQWMGGWQSSVVLTYLMAGIYSDIGGDVDGDDLCRPDAQTSCQTRCQGQQGSQH